jgi:hypothetical protein
MWMNYWEDNFIAFSPVSCFALLNKVFLNFIGFTGLREDDPNNELGRMLKETAVAYFKILS